MMLSEEANERLWDALLKEILIQNCCNELDELEQKTKPHTFSERFEKNIAKIERKVFGKERLKSAGIVIRKIFVAAMVIMGVTFGGLLTQPTVFASVQNVFRNIFSGYDEYTFSGEQQEDFIFDQNKRLGYIPDGYEIRVVFYSANNMYITYESVDGNTIKFDYGVAENSSKIIDNERHNYYELEYNNVTYYFYEALDPEADDNILIWYLDGYCFSLNAQLSKDEIIKVAENIITV